MGMVPDPLGSKGGPGHLQVVTSPNTGRVFTQGDSPRMPFRQGGELVPNPDGKKQKDRKGKGKKKWGKIKIPNWMKKPFGKNRDDEGPGAAGTSTTV